MIFADQKGVKASNGDLKTSAKIIDTQVKAYIARNILGDEGFFPIIKNIDNVLLEAIEKSKTPIEKKSSVTVTK